MRIYGIIVGTEYLDRLIDIWVVPGLENFIFFKVEVINDFAVQILITSIRQPGDTTHTKALDSEQGLHDFLFANDRILSSGEKSAGLFTVFQARRQFHPGRQIVFSFGEIEIQAARGTCAPGLQACCTDHCRGAKHCAKTGQGRTAIHLHIAWIHFGRVKVFEHYYYPVLLFCWSNE